jgi:hypothetical protein
MEPVQVRLVRILGGYAVGDKRRRAPGAVIDVRRRVAYRLGILNVQVTLRDLHV